MRVLRMAKIMIPDDSIQINNQDEKTVATNVELDYKSETDLPRYKNLLYFSEENEHPKRLRKLVEEDSTTRQQQGTSTTVKCICPDRNSNHICNSSKGEHPTISSVTLKEHFTIRDSNSLFQYSNVKISPFSFHSIIAENLSLKYARIFSKTTADCIFQRLEKEVKYFSGDLLKVKVYGKWHEIPRKQVSYGDPGLSYRFSGTCIPAVAWNECKIIMHLKEIVESVCQHSFNFVLVNRYKDGKDHMGEHRDDEKDLVSKAPIASLSFGQARDFIFKHKDSRGVNHTRKIDPVKLQLEHGSLLLMEWPTNQFWYHSLPVRAKAPNVRINLTFRKMVQKS